MFLWGIVMTKVALNHIRVGMYACGMCVCDRETDGTGHSTCACLAMRKQSNS